MSKVIIKDKELFYHKDDNSYEKIILSEKELYKKVEIYNKICNLKKELIYQIELSFTAHCRYLNVGIFHHDTFCIDVIDTMKKTYTEISKIRYDGYSNQDLYNDQEDYLFTTDTYIKFRKVQSTNTYQEYLAKKNVLVNSLLPSDKISDLFAKKLDSMIRYKIHQLWRMYNRAIKKDYSINTDFLYIYPLETPIYPIRFCRSKNRIERSHYVRSQIKQILETQFLAPFYKKYFIGQYNCEIIPYTDKSLLEGIIDILHTELGKLKICNSLKLNT